MTEGAEDKSKLPFGPPQLDDKGRILGPVMDLDYEFRSFPSFLDDIPNDVRDLLHEDCKAAFIRKSFWLSCDQKPRTGLESIARAIFDLHTKGAINYNPSRSGAEWWVHFRSPDSEDGETIGFHWDKDEYYADQYNTYVHPQVATVTYLTGHGVPTLVISQVPLKPDETSQVKFKTFYISHPRDGKHVAFDGRYLHGCPSELLSTKTPENYVRLTLLVNVWLDHQPLDTAPCPQQLLDTFKTPVISFDVSKVNQANPINCRTSAASSVLGYSFEALKSNIILNLPIPSKYPSPSTEDFSSIAVSLGVTNRGIIQRKISKKRKNDN